MSRYLTEADLTAIDVYLSTPRLSTYRSLVRDNSIEAAIELHQATMSLGIALMAVISLIEIALRNASCSEISKSFGTANWLRPGGAPPIHFSEEELRMIKQAEGQAQRAVYSKMTNAQKSVLDPLAYPNGTPQNIRHTTLVKARQRKIAVTDGQVIAQLTMVFWKKIYSDQYEPTLWKRALKKVFPNKTITRAQVASYLEVLYESRNRLAHHEPVYGARLDKALTAIEFVSMNVGSRVPSWENSFSKLILPQRDILEGQVAIFKTTFLRLT